MIRTKLRTILMNALVLALVLVSPALVLPALAQAPKTGTPAPDLVKPAETYKFCLDMARSYPEQGSEFAGKWLGLSGGEPAKHCQAVALMGLREYAEAATRLEELAQSSKRDNTVRAGLLAQAGQSWLLSGDTQRAHAAQTSAITLSPNDVRLFLDRATTLAEAKNYWEAIDDLNAAIVLDPKNAEAFAFRASAYRMVEADDLALDDAEAALVLDANNLSALLERGNLHRMKGHDAQARADWLKILTLAPESEAARAARANIEKLDVDPEK
jgi:tetratricopeptide (TPR) repeat protein